MRELRNKEKMPFGSEIVPVKTQGTLPLHQYGIVKVEEASVPIQNLYTRSENAIKVTEADAKLTVKHEDNDLSPAKV